MERPTHHTTRKKKTIKAFRSKHALQLLPHWCSSFPVAPFGDCSSQARVLPPLSASAGLLKQRARKKKLFSSELNSALRPGVVNFQRDQKKNSNVCPLAHSGARPGPRRELIDVRRIERLPLAGSGTGILCFSLRRGEEENKGSKRFPQASSLPPAGKGGSLVGGRENPLCCIPAPSLSASSVPRLPSLLAHRRRLFHASSPSQTRIQNE